MPFDPDNPPEKVKGLSEKKQRQWVEVFNSCWSEHADDAKCHAMAWGVVKKASSDAVAARELLVAARELLADDERALRDVNGRVEAYLGRVPGVARAAVNDWAPMSEGVYEVDFHVYADPRLGGRLTQKLKSQVGKLDRTEGVEVRAFWPPRSDRPISEVGWMGLKEFYERNPYKVTLVVRLSG